MVTADSKILTVIMLSCHDQEMMNQFDDRVVSSYCDPTGVTSSRILCFCRRHFFV